MNCNEARRWISPYLDSELDARTTFQVSQHLDACEGCRQRFERETRADELIAASLRRFEPVVDWSTVERTVRAPRRMRMWGSAGLLAAAACIALIVIAFGLPNRVQANPAQYAVEKLNLISPNCDPFSGSCGLGKLNDVSREVLEQGFPVPIASDGNGTEAIQLIHVERLVCSGGNPRLEVRLNCCGKPVLLTVGREDSMGELRGVCEALASCQSSPWTSKVKCKGREYDVAATARGGLVLVAVSPSPHVLDHIIRGAH